MTLDTPKARVTYRKEDHQAITDANFFNIVKRESEPGWRIGQTVSVPGEEVALPIMKS